MKKLIGIMVTILLLSSGFLSASLTRIAGLGINNWMIEEDDSLIWMNPARLTDYGETLWGEWPGIAGNLGKGGEEALDVNGTALLAGWGGISKKLNIADITSAIFVGRAYAGVLGNAGNVDPVGFPNLTPIPISGTPGGTNLAAKAPIGKYDLSIALPVSNMKVGIMLSAASDSESESAKGLNSPVLPGDQEMEDDFKSSDLQISIGGKMEDIGPLSSIDIVATLNMLNVENSYTGQTYLLVSGSTIPRTDTENTFKMDNAMNIGLIVRAVKEMDDYSLIGYIQYIKQDISNVFTNKFDINLDGDYEDVTPAGYIPGVDDNNYVQKREQKNTAITIGAAMNKKLSEKTLLICGIQLNSTKNVINGIREQKFSSQNGKDEEYKWEQKNTMVPVNLALEHKVSDAVVSRFGVSKNILNTRTTTINDPTYLWDGTKHDETFLITDEDTDDRTGVAATVSLGLGIKLFKNLTIDAVMRQQILFTGGYLISGIPETIVAQLTATLKF